MVRLSPDDVTFREYTEDIEHEDGTVSRDVPHLYGDVKVAPNLYVCYTLMLPDNAPGNAQRMDFYRRVVTEGVAAEMEQRGYG